MVAALALLLFFPSVHFSFAYDDLFQIQENPLVIAPSTALKTWYDPFTTPTYPGDLYRPFTTFTYRLNFLLSGLHPSPFHLTNVLLHALASVMTLLVVTPFLSRRAALWVGLAFAAHPIHVEPVANIVGRAELLAAVCGIGALLVYARSAMSERLVRRVGGEATSSLLMLAALLSKESALTLIILAPLYVKRLYPHMPTRELVRRTLLPTLCLVLAGCIALAARAAVLAESFVIPIEPYAYYPENPFLQLSFMDRVCPALSLLGEYLIRLVIPYGYSADYSLGADGFFRKLTSPYTVVSVLMITTFLVAVYHTRRAPSALFGVWFVIAFSLTANIVTPIGTIMGDRLAYLPSVGFLGFCAGAAQQLCISHRLARHARLGLGTLICISYMAASAARLPVWENNRILFEQTVRDAPLSPKAMMNHARELVQGGTSERAEPFLRRALELHPTYLEAMIHLTNLSLERRDYGRAEYWCRMVLKLEPGNREAAKVLETLHELKRRVKRS